MPRTLLLQSDKVNSGLHSTARKAEIHAGRSPQLVRSEVRMDNRVSDVRRLEANLESGKAFLVPMLDLVQISTSLLYTDFRAWQKARRFSPARKLFRHTSR